MTSDAGTAKAACPVCNLLDAAAASGKVVAGTASYKQTTSFVYLSDCKFSRKAFRCR
jgi:hypothetical protein